MPSLSLDDLSNKELLDLAAEVRDGWSVRDETIKRARETYKGTWTVPVPKAWKRTAQQQHSSKSKEIPERVLGTITMKPPQFSRLAPDDEVELKERASAVERYHTARVQYDRRTGVPGKNGYNFIAEMLIHQGAACVGSIYAPHDWAGAPLFLDGDKVRMDYWRDSAGRETDSEKDMDPEASSRAYERTVDSYRRRGAKPPIAHRFPETETVYPLFVEDRLLALFIYRKSTLLELTSAGYAVETLGTKDDAWSAKHELLEVVLPNSCRYFYGEQPIKHEKHGDRLITNYGFVPYAYRVGRSGGSLDWGSYGLPLLELVESNLRMIDTCLTYQFNALHMASFTSWWIEHLTHPDGTIGMTVKEGEKGKTLGSYDFKSGTIMDFGPDKKVQPFLHPGLNADFYKFQEFMHAEVERIIPRTLSGQAESSGYNTVQSSVQAKTIFAPLIDGLELLLEDVAVMDMKHINDRTTGPIYLEYEGPVKGLTRRRLQQIKVDKRDIGDYYQIRCTIDREPDRVTLGTWAMNLKAAGVLDDEEAYYEAMPDGDYEAHLARKSRDALMQDPSIQAALSARAVKKFGLEAAVREAQALAQIQQGPDGTPLVGGAGPGQGASLPAAQGAQGANAMNAGMPNLASTNNPAIEQPTPTGPGRMRRRGGATAGLPQRQPHHPTPEPAAA